MVTNVLGQYCTLIGIKLCGGEWPGQAAAIIVFGDDVKMNVED